MSKNTRNPLKYCAYIKCTTTGKRRNLGSAFLTPEDAFAVYKEEKVKDKATMALLWFEKGIITCEVRDLLLKYEITP